MKPMRLQPLYDALVGSGVVDPTQQNVLPMAIADAFEALLEIEAPSDDEKRLLMECSLTLTRANFRGLGSSAQSKVIELIQDNPSFSFRPAANPTPDPIE